MCRTISLLLVHVERQAYQRLWSKRCVRGAVPCCVCCVLLQGGSEKLSDEAIEETLEKVVKLLAYISDKDLFAEFYRKRLARRLLQVGVAVAQVTHIILFPFLYY